MTYPPPMVRVLQSKLSLISDSPSNTNANLRLDLRGPVLSALSPKPMPHLPPEGTPSVSMHELRAGLVYSATVFGAGFILGCVRVPLITPRLGERWAELAEMPVMAATIVCSARLVERRFMLSPDVTTRLAVGVVALTSLIATELALVRSLLHEGISEYMARKDPVAGTAYVAMLTVFSLMPLLLARHGGRKAAALFKKSLPGVPNTH